MAKNALNLGALTGLLIAVVQLLLFISGLGDISTFQWLLYLILIIAISWGVRKYRDSVNDGYLNYGQGVGFGVILSVGAAAVFAFFLYLYAKFMHAEYIPEMLEQMEITMYESEMDESQIEMIMNLYRQFLTPGIYAMSMIFNYTLMGLIMSLIISIFVKNPKPIFED